MIALDFLFTFTENK
jgi:hypothetical protein